MSTGTNRNKAKIRVRPKVPTNSYGFFLKHAYAFLKENPPPGKLNVIQTSNYLATLWKNLSTEQKRPFEQMFNRDQNRYMLEARMMGLKLGSSIVKRRRNSQFPKRPRNSFVLFCNDQRAELKKQHANLGFGELQKELGKMWQNMDAESKNKYQAMAKQEVIRYRALMAGAAQSQNSCA